MNIKHLELLISCIDDKYIYEAEQSPYKLLKAIKISAACLGIIFVLTASSLTIAVTAGSIPVHDALYALYPEIAQKLSPVRISCQDNGIRMEVESAYIHNDTADVYISMQDLTGERIGSGIDLFDSYNIFCTSDSQQTCSLIDYDEKMQKATFLIHIQQTDGEKISGRKMTFRVREFLSGKQIIDTELAISLKDAAIVTDVQTNDEIQIRGGSGEFSEIAENIKLKCLKPGGTLNYSPTEGVEVTAIGYVDKQLHVQVHYENILHTDNHGYVYLKNKSGNTVQCSGGVSFWDESQTGSFDEYIFDISPEDDLRDYSIWGYFVTCKEPVTGNWQVTFPMENME